MSLRSFIKRKIIYPLQAFPCQYYYSAKKTYIPLNNSDRDFHIVVSLTSFPARFGTLHYAIKSILTQRMKPDLIFLCLTKSEVKDETELPPSVLALKQYGLRIFFADDNLKPHNKYYYAMKLYPDSLHITVDDDNMYDKNLIHDLYYSFLNNPDAISARRVHKMRRNDNGELLPYTKWFYEYKKEIKPSHALLATGVGGVLYPPGILPGETFNAQKIRELCLNADDIWLKFMELKNNIPVVWVKSNKVHPLPIGKTQKITLQANNYHENQNDKYIAGLQNHYCLNLASLMYNGVNH
jgi:hypothetical protein